MFKLYYSLTSSIGSTGLSGFLEEPHYFAVIYIYVNEVIAFCLHLMNKMQGNLKPKSVTLSHR